MAGSAQAISAVTVREWARTDVELLDRRLPTAAVVRVAMGVVEQVERAHERGRAPLGLGPDTAVVTETGEVRLTAPADYATAEDRAADLADLGALLFFLATGIDPDVVGIGSSPRIPYEQVDRLISQLTVGNPCATALAPIILALLHPNPRRRPPASKVRVLLNGHASQTGRVPNPRADASPGSPVNGKVTAGRASTT